MDPQPCTQPRLRVTMDPQPCTQPSTKVEVTGMLLLGAHGGQPQSHHGDRPSCTVTRSASPSRDTTSFWGSTGEAHTQTPEAPRTTHATQLPSPRLSEKVGPDGHRGTCPGGAAAAGTDPAGRGRLVSLPRETRWKRQMTRRTSPGWPAQARVRRWHGSAGQWRGAVPVAVKSPHLLRQTTCLWLK